MSDDVIMAMMAGSSLTLLVESIPRVYGDAWCKIRQIIKLAKLRNVDILPSRGLLDLAGETHATHRDDLHRVADKGF